MFILYMHILTGWFSEIYEWSYSGSEAFMKNVYMPNGNFRILSVICRLTSVVICVLAPSYSSLCRGLEYLFKFRYIILVYPRRIFFNLKHCFCYGMETLPYVWNKYYKKDRHLHPTFTECISNQYTHFNIFTCQM